MENLKNGHLNTLTTSVLLTETLIYVKDPPGRDEIVYTDIKKQHIIVKHFIYSSLHSISKAIHTIIL